MKTYIWFLPTRVFHWLLAFGFVFAWFSGDFQYIRNLHYAFGAYVGVLLLLRFPYGFFGPAYSRFADFPMGLKHQKEYLLSMKGRAKEYAGHNPVAAVIMLLMIVVGVATALTGYFYYTALVRLNGAVAEIPAGKWHHIGSTVFMALVLLHLVGLFADAIKRKHAGNLRSMITGYKPLEAKEGKMTGFQMLYAVVWMLLPFLFFYLAYRLPV
jgi:cytochrome b